MVTNGDRKSFGSLAKKETITNISHTTGTVEDFDPRPVVSEPLSRKASALPNLHECWTQTDHVRCPVAQILIQPKSGWRYSKTAISTKRIRFNSALLSALSVTAM
jgi:hypothetical protein